MKDLDTPTVIAHIQRGDTHAITVFYKHMYKPLFLYINKRIQEVAVSEEIAQDTLLAIIEDIRSKQHIISLTGLSYAIARHKIVDHFRKQKIKKVLMSAVPERIIDMCALFFFREHVETNDIADKIERILKLLPNEYAVVIRLKYMEGFPVQKIALKMSLSFKAAESMLFRARKIFVKLYSASE